MERNWNKISAQAGVVSCVLAALGLGIMIWPLLPSGLPWQAAAQAIPGWVPLTFGAEF